MSKLPPLNPTDLDDRPEVVSLFKRLKSALPELEKRLEECTSHWGYEDPIYRFYHQSFKVYLLQNSTWQSLRNFGRSRRRERIERMVRGDRCGRNRQDFRDGRADESWLGVTRPILEAFFHAPLLFLKWQ